MTEAAYARDRRRLVERLRALGVQDLAVLHAFDSVPRHLFVPEAVRHRAYQESALPLGFGQTISRPAVHATYLGLVGLRGSEKVLEIGTGSGFQTALLSRLCAQVCSIERIPELAERAAEGLAAIDADNVRLRIGDGSLGWPEEAPFDAILVGAAAPEVPPALLEQLADHGQLLVPVGEGQAQELLRVVRTPTGFEQEAVDRARFVPLIGVGGWSG